MRALGWAQIVVASMGLLLLGEIARGDDSQANGKEQIWEGTLKVRAGFELRLVIRVQPGGGGEPVATLDSPDEGFSGLKLSSVVIDRSRLAFELKDLERQVRRKAEHRGDQGDWQLESARRVFAARTREEGQGYAGAESRRQRADLGREARLGRGAFASNRREGSENRGRPAARQVRQPRSEAARG